MNNRRVDGRHPWRPVDWRGLLLLGLLMPSVGTAVEDEQPSTDLLEFLGSWESKDSDGTDPVSLLDMLLDDTESTSQQTQPEGKQDD